MDQSAVLKKTLPNIVRDIGQTYTLLRGIMALQPIGRRALAVALDRGEREVRADTDFLRNNQVLKVTASGMYLTDTGLAAADGLGELLHTLSGVTEKEKRIQSLLGVETKISDCGKTANDIIIKTDIGYNVINDAMNENADSWAVDASGVLSQIAKALPNYKSLAAGLYTCRAGEKDDRDNIAILAKKLGVRASGTDIILPDLAKDMPSFIGGEKIKEYLEKLNACKLVIAPVNEATEAMIRSNLPHRMVNILLDQGAVAEFLGYYLKSDGRIIYTSTPLALSIDAINKAKLKVIATGKKDCNAVKAVTNRFSNAELYMDLDLADALISKSAM